MSINISFRANKELESALVEFNKPGESLNITAQRLLMELLGLVEIENNNVLSVEEKLNNIVDIKLIKAMNNYQIALDKLEEKIKEVELSLNKLAIIRQDSVSGINAID